MDAIDLIDLLLLDLKFLPAEVQKMAENYAILQSDGNELMGNLEMDMLLKQVERYKMFVEVWEELKERLREGLKQTEIKP